MNVIYQIKALNWWMKIIMIFCLLGFFRNCYYGVSVVVFGGSLKVYAGFALAYLCQAILIIFWDKRAVLFSVLQLFFGLFIGFEFTFMPVLQPLCVAFMHLFPYAAVEHFEIMKYLLVSVAFTLDLLKTYMIFDFLTPEKELLYEETPA